MSEDRRKKGGRSHEEVAQDRLDGIMRDALTSTVDEEYLKGSGVKGGGQEIIAAARRVRAEYDKAATGGDRGRAALLAAAEARELAGSVAFAARDSRENETNPRKLVEGIPPIR